MLEFSSPLRSSGFLSSNYTEVLPDASRHCRTQKNPVSAQSQPIFQDWEKEMLPSQMLSFASVYANSVLKFHNVSSFFLFCRIARRSLDARTNRKTWILRKESCSCVVIYRQQQHLVSAILSYP